MDPPDRAHPEARAGRRYVRLAAAALVTVMSLYFLLPSLAAVFSSWRSLTQLRWYWIVPALAAQGGSFVALWQLDRIALKTTAWFPVACAQLSGNAVGRIVPGGAATSTAVAVGMLRRSGIATDRSVPALAAAAALQIAASLALPLAALPAIVGGAPAPRSLVSAGYLGVAVLLLLVAGGAAAFAADRPLATVGRWAEALLNATLRRRRPITGLPNRLLRERDFIRSGIGERWQPALVAAAVSTGFDYLTLLFVLRAVGAQPRPTLVILAYTSARLLALIPFTPGGLGFVEAGLVGTLTLAAVPPDSAVAAVFAYRVISFWLPIPAGGIAYGLHRRRYG